MLDFLKKCIEVTKKSNLQITTFYVLPYIQYLPVKPIEEVLQEMFCSN